MKRNLYLLFIALLPVGLLFSSWKSNNLPDEKQSLPGSSLKLSWVKNKDGWKVDNLLVKKDNQWVALPNPGGEYTILYSTEKPDSSPAVLYRTNNSKIIFPEPVYKFVVPLWNNVINPVQLNTAGQAIFSYPQTLSKLANGSVKFVSETKISTLEAIWNIDENYPSDINVSITVKAKVAGYFSVATPSLVTVPKEQLTWGILPGYFQGSSLENDFVKAYAYGQGIPDRPVVVRERTASTLSPVITTKNGISIGVIPEPCTDRDPWLTDKSTHTDWLLGLSLMNRKSDLTPTLYHPVLGQKGSWLKAGETVSFKFRYSVMPTDWYPVYKHALWDIYHFKDFLSLKKTSQSLTDRIFAMHRYVINDVSSKWRIEEFNGSKIGGQAYNAGIRGANGDAMKNSDYGAMWMMATIMNDSVLKQTRLPFARNFKLEQQQTAPGLFNGAVAGQYYLSKSKRFTEEWGTYTEPIAITYYNLLDIGNILLFNPGDSILRSRLTSGAEKLLEWQGAEGNWQIAYDEEGKPMFTELEDLRPTFYGMIVAYNILKDKKYLAAACKGADWLIKNSVDKGHFLGVCGDIRFIPDFATGQIAQALLDLYDLTKNPKYKEAAIKTARFYTTSIYTHPIPSRQVKTVNGIKHEDWEISQVGLSFEHGGNVGSANNGGPILLASHAGLFVRIYELTHDSVYLNMARAAALGRDAFVDQKTSVASYYWSKMNAGPGEFPHHAWWQIGWLTDYLLSEAEMRSAGKITFPHGFISPKVGPHKTYGFAPGNIYGNKASLSVREGLLKAESPYLDFMTAANPETKNIYFILLNSDDELLKTTITLDSDALIRGSKIKRLSWINESGKTELIKVNEVNLKIEIPPFGVKVIEAHYDVN